MALYQRDHIAAKQDPCTYCKGRGWKRVTTPTRVFGMPCQQCNGIGTRTAQQSKERAGEHGNIRTVVSARTVEDVREETQEGLGEGQDSREEESQEQSRTEFPEK